MSPDASLYCPTPSCGRYITDYDDNGCEDNGGQHWCITHRPADFPGPEQYLNRYEFTAARISRDDTIDHDLVGVVAAETIRKALDQIEWQYGTMAGRHVVVRAISRAAWGSPPRDAPACPQCGRIMTFREADEQGACNDCTRPGSQ